MATYTITTAINIDTLASKVGSDTYNINGGYLVIDQDTRYGTNQNTSAAMGNITLSATLGGIIEFTSINVRIIPYNSGTGTVPAYDTTISQGSASGILLSVYATLASAPTAVGAAMPASGFIKIRQWNNVAYVAGALTGIGASATAEDRAGWLEIVGVDALTCTINRLNTFYAIGDWFDLGTTTGTRATTYQIPSNGAIVYLPGVYVETGTATDTYEFYPCAGSLTALAANVATDEVRGRFCWISTTGLLRFGHDGTNSTGGFIPESGRKVRIPNIFFMCCTAAALTANVLPNATLATRYEFATTGGGAIHIDKACVNWYMNLNQAYSIYLNYVGILTSLVCTELASPIYWTGVGVGQEAANSQFALSMSLNFAGGTMIDCVWSRATLASSGHYVCTYTDISNFAIYNQRIHALGGVRGNATSGAQTLTRTQSSSWTSCTFGGGRTLLTTCSALKFNSCIYYDNPATTTPVTIPQSAFELLTACSNIKIDGLYFGNLTLCQPYTGILSIGAAGCTNIYMRNLGSAASPLDMGSSYVDATWTRATTTMTITKTAHGLKTNDLIAVNIVSDIAPKAVTTTTATLWTVASAPTANTFTVTVTNAGATSGTISYYPAMVGQLVTIAAAAAANNIKIQRCYTPHLRTGVMSGDNSSKNILLENVWGTEWGVQLVPELNCSIRGFQSTPALTAQTSCYGTHFIDYYLAGVSSNLAAVSWARTTTTATITSTGHNLRTGNLINVTVTSDNSTIILGQKTITAITADTFTFTCLNAGGASGTLTFTQLVSRFAIQMNESTADTSSQYTIDAGAPAFTSAGGLYMPNVGDQITFTTPVNIIGYTGFPIAEAVMAGGTIGNYDITYSISQNDGTETYSSFKNLYYIRAGGGGSISSTTVTMTDTTGVSAGDYIWGTNVAPNAKVVSVDSGTNITVNIANTGTVSGSLRFNQLPSEIITSSLLGFKLKLRILTTIANATAISSLYFYTTSTAVSRGYQYALDFVLLSVKVLNTLGSPIENARVAIFDSLTNTLLLNTLTNASGFATGTTSYTGDANVYIRVRKTSTGSTRYINNDSSDVITETGLSSIVTILTDIIASF